MTAYEAMKALGIAQVVGRFSGGNDEGGYDDYAVTLSDGEAPTEQFKDFHPYQASPSDPRLVVIAEQLESVLEGQYAGFTGEGYVSGTVTLDAAAGTTTIEEPESSSRVVIR